MLVLPQCVDIDLDHLYKLMIFNSIMLLHYVKINTLWFVIECRDRVAGPSGSGAGRALWQPLGTRPVTHAVIRFVSRNTGHNKAM